MLTTDQAKEYLASQQITLPDVVLAALVEQANTINDCLSANYSESTATLIQLYLLGLFGLAQADGYLASQHAPSGASRSFRYQAFADRWAGLINLLEALDPNGCASALIPADPTKPAKGGLWLGTSKPSSRYWR